MICRDRVRAIGKFTIDRDNRVPAAVKSQVAAETENAIANRAIVGDKPQRPDFRVKYALRVGRLNVVNARLQESDQRRILEGNRICPLWQKIVNLSP